MRPIFAEYSRTPTVTPGRGIDVTAIVGSGAVVAAFLVDMIEDRSWMRDDEPLEHAAIMVELRRRIAEI